MCIESDLTIREHFDSLRQQVDIAREIALENIHKASSALMTTEVIVEDGSKRMRTFIAEQQAYLQSVQASNQKLTLRLDEANKLAQELSDRKKELKARQPCSTTKSPRSSRFRLLVRRPLASWHSQTSHFLSTNGTPL